MYVARKWLAILPYVSHYYFHLRMYADNESTIKMELNLFGDGIF